MTGHIHRQIQYKAIMLDVDGTLVPYDYSALPSEKVTKAIKKASKKAYVCIVTGRSYPFTLNIFKHLGLNKGLSVVNGGAHVIDLETKELLYEQPIDKNAGSEIARTLRSVGIPFFLKQDIFDSSYMDGYFQNQAKITTPFMFYTDEVCSIDQVNAIIAKLSHIKEIRIDRNHHKDPMRYSINITHAKSTKQNGIEVIMKKLNLLREEIIGVGDSYNDFPLLYACGLKVAMGNAADDLKKIADYIAPSVYDDGVEAVLRKYIL